MCIRDRDKLKQVDALDCLKLLHYHQGSQIPNISVVREGLTEAVRIYVDLVKEGAPVGTLDMGCLLYTSRCV